MQSGSMEWYIVFDPPRPNERKSIGGEILTIIIQCMYVCMCVCVSPNVSNAKYSLWGPNSFAIYVINIVEHDSAIGIGPSLSPLAVLATNNFFVTNSFSDAK